MGPKGGKAWRSCRFYISRALENNTFGVKAFQDMFFLKGMVWPDSAGLHPRNCRTSYRQSEANSYHKPKSSF